MLSKLISKSINHCKLVTVLPTAFTTLGLRMVMDVPVSKMAGKLTFTVDLSTVKLATLTT